VRPDDEGGLAAPLTADTVLGQIEAAVLVTDRLGHLRYANTYAVGLFGLPGDAGRLAGLSVLPLMCGEADPGGAAADEQIDVLPRRRQQRLVVPAELQPARGA